MSEIEYMDGYLDGVLDRDAGYPPQSEDAAYLDGYNAIPFRISDGQPEDEFVGVEPSEYMR